MNKRGGFTIVELLVVIVVISIIAAIAIIGYNGIRDRSKAASIVTDIKAADKAFRLWGIDEDKSMWWVDTDLQASGNPTITWLIANTNLKNYLKGLSPNTGSSDNWTYDNDNDVYGGCSTSSTGVNLNVFNIDPAVAQIVDRQLDDNNTSCGNITTTTAGVPNTVNIRYSLSRVQNF